MAKHAFLFLSSPDDPGKLANGLTYARQLDDAGHDVAVYFDGAATQWLDAIEDAPPPAVEAYEAARDRGLFAGVCSHCSTVHGTDGLAADAGFDVAGMEHSPNVAALVDDGYAIHTI